jgi:mannitol-1-/sugar-/sorbitol-6-phosphatase
MPTYDAVLFDLFGTLVDDAAEPIDGALASLDAVKNARWAIVTSCGLRFAQALLAHAHLPVPEVLVTADDVLRNKPAPDGYLYAAQRLRVKPARALVIEDSLQGIAAAREAAMDVVAVLRGRSPGFARAATYTAKTIAAVHLRTDGDVIEFDVPD